MKKLTIILGLVIAIFVGLIGYFYFIKDSNSNTGIINTISNLFPNSTNRDISTDLSFPNATSSSEQVGLPISQIGGNDLTSKFQKISNNGVAGANLVTSKDTNPKSLTSNIVWYIEKATGYVFSYDPNTAEQKQISNTTWIGGQETYWGENKGVPTFILRRSKNSTIENFLAKISNSSTSSIGELVGTTINAGISTMTSSPKKDRYAYLISSPSGSVGYIANFSNLGLPIQIFTSTFSKWQISWPEENTLIFQSAPLFDQNGLVYTLNLKTKAFTRQIGGVRGLTILGSPDGKKILYAENLNLKVKLIEKKVPDLIFSLATFPEKCVWLKDSIKVYCSIPNSVPLGEYPDTWYQGLVNFSDSIWEINTLTGATKQIYDPAGASEKYQIDGINLFLSKDESKLFITNKTDYTLWQLNLSDSFNTELDQKKLETNSTSTTR